MKIIKMPISKLQHPENNVRIHSPQQIREFVRSLEQFGQTRLAVIDENNEILIGNGMVMAMREAGWTEVECERRTDLDKNAKLKLMMADNKLYSMGIDDLEAINSIIAELEGDFGIPGYSDEVLESMVATAEEITETLSAYGTLDEDEIKAIKESGKRKEDQVAKIQQGESSVSFVPPSKATASSDGEVAELGSENEAGSFIICHNCGEKIWL